MATSTYMTFLMKKSTSTWEKLVDIKDFPDLGGKPEQIETTTLSDGVQTYINGIQSAETLEFTANYDLEKYKSIKADKGKEGDYAIWFGGTESGGTVTPTGEFGKHEFKGYPDVYVKGAATNAVREMGVIIAPSSAITLNQEA